MIARLCSLERLREVFHALPNARLELSSPSIRTEGIHGYWTAKITVKDSGELADIIQSRVNSLDTPFEFRNGDAEAPWPWDWKAVSPSKIPPLRSHNL